MSQLMYDSIDSSAHSPEQFIEENQKFNHIGMVEFISDELKELNILASFVYPEDQRAVTIEIVERVPATLSSKTVGSSHVMNRPMTWRQETNIVSNLEETYKIQFFDNTMKITIFEKNTIDAEKLAYMVESVLIKKYHFIRKHVDNVLYKGRLTPGFTSAYNDRKLYAIPLVITFRTSEMFHESNPVIRDIKTDIGLT